MRILKLLSLLLFISELGTAQQKTGFELGAGFPSGYTVGFFSKYSPTTKLELNYGTDLKFADDKIVHTLTLNHGYYFGTSSTKYERKLWAINTGLVFGYSNSSLKKTESLILNIHFSREMCLSPKWSLEPMLGIAGFLMRKVEKKDEFLEKDNIPVFPVFGVKLLFHL